jgi:CheY-like chemotaxis protein
MATRSHDANTVEPPDIDAMLRSARDALFALQERPGPIKPGFVIKATIVLVCLIALVALYVHTFAETGSPRVDTTSVALLAVVLLAPFVPRLRAVELAGAKAEWREEASASIGPVLTVIRLQHRALEQLYVDSLAANRPEDESSTPDASPEGLDRLTLRPLEHILWVDDHPENNAYEIEALRSTAKVTVATSTRLALDIITEGDIDAVISDISRNEGGREVDDAGVQLLRRMQSLPPSKRVEVFFYSVSPAVERYGSELEKRGAAVVTTSHRELFQALRRHQNRVATETVRDMARHLARTALLDVPDSGVDCVIGLDNGRRIGLEVPSWVTRPQMSAFTDRTDRLISAREAGLIDEAWLLVDDAVLDSRRRAYAAEKGVRIVSLATVRDDLETAAAA